MFQVIAVIFMAILSALVGTGEFAAGGGIDFNFGDFLGGISWH